MPSARDLLRRSSKPVINKKPPFFDELEEHLGKDLSSGGYFIVESREWKKFFMDAPQNLLGSPEKGDLVLISRRGLVEKEELLGKVEESMGNYGYSLNQTSDFPLGRVYTLWKKDTE